MDLSNKAKKVALLGVLTSVALVLSYLESIIPPIWAAVPGIKMGLPNIVIIFLLYRFGVKEAAVVSFIRIFIVALLFGNVMTLAYSVAGALLSIVLMAICKKINAHVETYSISIFMCIYIYEPCHTVNHIERNTIF